MNGSFLAFAAGFYALPSIVAAKGVRSEWADARRERGLVQTVALAFVAFVAAPVIVCRLALDEIR